MKYLIVVLAFLLSSCTTKTQHGECIGVFDDENQSYKYQISKKNVLLAVLFSGALIVPANVVLWNTYCPVEKK